MVRFLFLLFGLFFFVDGLLLVITASKQQEKLLRLRQSLLEDDPQIVASAEEFMAQRKSLTQQGEITGIFIVHNATKDLYYVGQSAKAIDRAAIQFLGRGNCDVCRLQVRRLIQRAHYPAVRKRLRKSQ